VEGMDGIVVVVVDVSGKWNEVGGVGVGKKKNQKSKLSKSLRKTPKKKNRREKKSGEERLKWDRKYR